jgi:multiple sugar transport system substrate-binding protein
MPAFEISVIDHREIYEECRSKYGKPIDLAVKSTYNPKTKKYFGFAPYFVPLAFNYRKDLWDGVGVTPDTWDDVRKGGRSIKQKNAKPLWLFLGRRLLFAPPVLSLMDAFGASIQDEEGKVILDSKETMEAVRFVSALYAEAMTNDVISWDDLACDFHDELILSGKISSLMTSLAPTRTAEITDPEMSKKVQLAKPPKGPVRRIGHCHVPVYFIWEFAENIEGAKKFLVDYVGRSREVFLTGKFRDHPCFPDTVPDLKKLVADDPKAHPADKYKLLDDALNWTTHLGFPGYASAAIEEIMAKRVVQHMLIEVALGKARPEDAVRDADAECRRIFGQWRQTGRV